MDVFHLEMPLSGSDRNSVVYFAYLFNEGREDLARSQTLRKLVQNASQTLHKRDLLFSCFCSEVRAVEKIEGGDRQGREEGV